MSRKMKNVCLAIVMLCISNCLVFAEATCPELCLQTKNQCYDDAEYQYGQCDQTCQDDKQACDYNQLMYRYMCWSTYGCWFYYYNQLPFSWACQTFCEDNYEIQLQLCNEDFYQCEGSCASQYNSEIGICDYNYNQCIGECE